MDTGADKGCGLADAPRAHDWQAPAASGPVRALVRLPGSKSMTNRALVLAALADGPTTIRNPLRARDTELMAAALRALGAEVAAGDAGGPQSAPAWLVTPAARGGPAAGGAAAGDTAPARAGGGSARSATVDVGNAGTVLRFVPPAAALTTADVTFRGDDRASARPVGPLLAALRELGATIDDQGRGAVPFIVRGRGAVRGGTVTLDASASSQLVSGLLLAAARFDKGAEIRHNGPRMPSAPHLAMTVQMIREAGADVETGSLRPGGAGAAGPVNNLWRVHPGALAPGTVTVEPDLSNAGPFLAAALVTAGTVTVAGWPGRTTQPAAQILAVLTAMGAVCTATADGMQVTGPGEIRGVTADLRDVSELSPVLTAVAALASGPSVFTGIGHQRAQECDRLAALAAGIGALGGDVTEHADGLEIRPRPLRGDGAVFATHDDHRLVMAAAVLGLATAGLRVQNAATVGKTFPGFTSSWAAMLGRAP
jgi:3-phosphoshikimate 1-carboxyvinyltransferase